MTMKNTTHGDALPIEILNILQSPGDAYDPASKAAKLESESSIPCLSMTPAAYLAKRGYDRREPQNYDVLERWMQRRFDGTMKRGLLLLGHRGTGKTSGLRHAAEYADICRVWEANQLLQLRREDPDRLQRMGGRVWLSAWRKRCLMIDELAGEGEPGYWQGARDNWMAEFIHGRHALWERLGTLTHFTCNFSLTRDPKRPDVLSIEQMYGSHIVDRLQEMCYCVTFKGESQRERSRDDDFAQEIRKIRQDS